MKKRYLLFSVLLFFSLVPVTTKAQSIDPDVLDRVSQAVVLIIGLQDGEPVSSGSGTFVSSDGLIYTNRHVLEDADDYAIFVLEDVNEQPEFMYYASPTLVFPYDVEGSQLDFAVLQVDRNTEGNALLRPSIRVPSFVDASEFRQMRRGEPIFVIGYPGIAEMFQVLTQGIITTVQNGDVAGDRVPVWYQTDAEISPGNSGGLAVDIDGNPIGIPSSVVSESRTGGRLGGVLPLDFVAQVVANIPPLPVSVLVDGNPGGGDEPEVAGDLADAMSIEITDIQIDVSIPDFAGTYAVIVADISASQLVGTDLSVGVYFYWAPDGEFEPVPGQIEDYTLSANGGLVVREILTPSLSSETWDDYIFVIPMEAFPSITSLAEIVAVPDMGIAGDRLVAPGAGYTFDLSPTTVAGGEGGIEITCPGGQEITNGVEITVFQMRPGFTYTATVVGVDGFDPVLAIVPSDLVEGGEAALCNDDSDTASNYQVGLPTTGNVNGTNLSSQEAFSHSRNENMSISLIVGDYNGDAGEFVLILEGMFYTQADGVGDIFILNVTPNVAASGVEPTIYMIGSESQLDPYFYVLDLETEDVLQSSSGEAFSCDDAGTPLCFGTSQPLTASFVRSGNSTVSGDNLDAMMSLPVLGDIDDNLPIPFVMSSFNQQTTGAYTMLFHVGVR